MARAQDDMLEALTGSEHIRTAAQEDVPALHALVEAAYRGNTARRGWTYEADLLGGQRTDTDKLDELIAASESAILIAAREDGSGPGSPLGLPASLRREPDNPA